MGKQNTKEYWICNNCGNKFQSKDIKKIDKKSGGESIISKARTLLQNTEIGKSPKPEPTKAAPESNNIVPVTPQIQDRPVLQENKTASFEPKTKIKRTSKYEGTLSVEELLKRAKIFIEDKDWEKACEYCQNALDVDAGCADAYFAMFMAEYNISDEEQIPLICGEMTAKLGSLFAIESYKKASRFGDDNFKIKLDAYNQQAIYIYAVEFSDNCTTPEECDRAKVFFKRIPDYLEFKDVKEKLENCDDKKNALIYGEAVSLMHSYQFEEAIKHFESIPNYTDSQQKIKECNNLRNKYIYDRAVSLLNNAEDVNDIIEAKKKFLSIAGYKDAEKMAEQCSELRMRTIYDMACEIMDGVSCRIYINDINLKECLSGQTSDIKEKIKRDLFLSKTDALYAAKEMFMSISDYGDSKNKVEECDKKIETLRNGYECFIKTVKTAVIVFVACVLLLCISIPIVRSISDRKTSYDTVASSYENEVNENQYTPALSDTQPQSGTVSATSSVKYDKKSETDGSVGEFILYDNTYDSDTIDYIGTYDGWTYFSDVTNIISENRLNLYGTVYFCNVAIRRINIETRECENLIKTCCSSSVYDTFTQYYNYDFTIGDDGKLVFGYDDPNTFRMTASDEYGGKVNYYCNSYVLSYDVNTNEISQLCSDTSPFQFFYYNGWLMRYFARVEKNLLIDTVHNETYEDNNNCWISGYDGKYILLTDGNSFWAIDTVSSLIAEYYQLDLDFAHMYDRGEYIYLTNKLGHVKYVLDVKNQKCSDSVPNDAIESYLPIRGIYIGENNQGTFYEKDKYICLSNNYKNADFSIERIFNFKDILSHEKEIYKSYGFQDEFEDILFYYDFDICGKWVVINTSVNSIDVSYENHYYLNSETGICSNVPITNGIGQYKDASNYISGYNEADDFEFSIGYVSIDSGVLNVRSEPSSNSSIVGTLENNTKVEIYDYKNGWYLIYYYDYDTNLYGYASSDYITIY